MIDNETANTETHASGASESAPQTTQEILDLDGVSNFKFQGQTYTPDQFQEIYQGYQKYGEASKYMEEDQRYQANVEHDIEKVLRNPARIDEFKQTYPERYHKYLDRVLNSNQRGTENSGQAGQLPKEVMDKLSSYEQRIAMQEQRAFQSDVAAASAKIDAILPNLLSKYEMADQDKVLFEAEKILSKGGKLTDAAWERIVREDHERMTSKADKVYQAKLKAQVTKGKQGADTGPGGATPGGAPVMPKTFAQAQEAMIASLRQRGLK